MTTATATRAPARTDGLPLVLLGELALAAVSLASVLSLRRVFVGSEWFAPLALQVVAAHTVTSLLRRRGVTVLLSVVLSAAAGAVMIAAVHAGELTTFGIPTPATFDALADRIADAFAAWDDVKAPTEALDGFVIATAVAVWVGAILADWAAFRVDAPLESTLPATTLFLLAAVLGADVDRILLTGVFAAAVLAFVLFRRADRLGRTATWVGERRAHGPPALVGLGVALALVAVAVAAVVGPRLPGAESEAVVSLRDLGDDGPGSRVTVSPLVDIRTRLVNQASVEVFTVRSPVPSYWRLTSLDSFDGRIWSSNGSYGKASGTLDRGVPVVSDRVEFPQAFTISALAQIWLPAAYEPRSIDVAQDVRYDEVSGTLIVDTDIPTSDGLTYQVTSALPQHDPAALTAASTAIPPEIEEQYLDLPDDFPGSVAARAQEVVAGATSRYDQAMRLQNWFRDNFTYDLEVGNGHSGRAIEHFVLDEQRGYCEQFAGSFAAMARSLGIPARVAVGFTQGVASAEEPDLYRVRGEHAHAWPEVYLGEYGWVMFEPTPGRGAPFADHTGVPAQQVDSGGAPDTATTAVAPPTSGPGAAPTSSVPLPSVEDPRDVGTGADAGTDEEEPALGPWPGRVARAAAALIGLAVLYLVVVLAATSARRWQRRRSAHDGRERVAVAWDESITAVTRAGVPVRPTQTATEVAARVDARLPSVAAPMRTLALTVERSGYAPVPTSVEAGDEALALADEIERAIAATLTRRQRLRMRFHPEEFVRAISPRRA